MFSAGSGPEPRALVHLNLVSLHGGGHAALILFTLTGLEMQEIHIELILRVTGWSSDIEPCLVCQVTPLFKAFPAPELPLRLCLTLCSSSHLILPSLAKGLDWHMGVLVTDVLAALGYYMYSASTCPEAAACCCHKEEKQSSSQLHFGKAQTATLSVSLSRLVGKSSVFEDQGRRFNILVEAVRIGQDYGGMFFPSIDCLEEETHEEEAEHGGTHL